MRREDKKWEEGSENPNRPKNKTVYRALPKPDEPPPTEILGLRYTPAKTVIVDDKMK